MRILHIALRALAWSLIGLALVLALVMVRLSAGPVQLDWLKPRIEQALVPEGGRVAATAGGVELRFNRQSRTLALIGVDVRYRVGDANELPAASFLAFPEVELKLSVEALLKRGMIAASQLTARAPSLIITRSENGVIGLFSGEDYEGRADDIDFGDFLRRFTLAPQAGSRLAFLNELSIGGGRVAYYDRTRASALTAEAADMVLTRREGGVDGWVRASILQKSAGPASVKLSGRYEASSDHIVFSADIADLMPADLPALWPLNEPAIPAEVAGLRLPVRASIDGKVDVDGGLSPLDVDLQAESGTVDLPAYLAETLDVESAEIRGTIGSNLDFYEIDHGRIVSRGATFAGAGGLVWRQGERKLRIDLDAEAVRIEDLPGFWPPRLGSKARAWVLENIEAGEVSDAEISIDLGPDDFGPGPLRDDALAGKVAFEGLSVRYLDEMPPIDSAFGTAAFDADRMVFEVEGGRHQGLALKGGSVTITGMGRPGRRTTQLHVLADAEGSIEDALSILDNPPLRVAQDLDITPSDVEGDMVTRIDVRLPLHGGVTAEEAVVLAEADLTDLAIDRLPKVGADLRIEGGFFKLALDEEAVRLDGTAAVNGIPLAVDIVEPRKDETAKRRIGLGGNVGRQQLQEQGIAVDGLEGDIDFKAVVTETDSRLWVDLEADLTALSIAPPGLVWEKPIGQAGMLHAAIAVPFEGPIEIKQFDLATGDLAAAGSLAMSAADGRFRELVLNRLQLADTDAAIRLTSDGDRGFDLVIEARRLDLDALVGRDHEISERFERFHALLRADEVLARGIEFTGVEVDATRTEEGWRSASVTGAMPSGGKLALELKPEGDEQSLEVRSEDAGTLIEALDLGQRIDGGDLLLTARIRPGDPAAADGRFEIEGFVLKDAPILARMLTLASLTGISNLFEGEGIQIDHLIMPFALADRKLTITDGLMRGSQLGLTLKGDVGLEEGVLDVAGTIIPVYSLNRLIGQVPIIGRILTGVDGRGAFAATYSIKGPRSDPTVYVNPLSILTPGLIRDLFGGILNGTLEPPDVRETDD